MPAVFFANLVPGAVLAFTVAKFNQATVMIAVTWYVILFCFTFVRFLHWNIVRKKELHVGNFKKTRNEFIVFSFVSGLNWGLAGLIFFNESNPVIAAVSPLILAGMVSGSVSMTSADPPIYYAYAFPTMLPLAFYTLYLGTPITLAIGVLMIYFVMANILACSNVNKTITETLRLRFEKNELIEELQEQKQVAEKANEAKSKFLAAASHDLRQPLHAQGLFLGLLSNENLTERGEKTYQNILNSKNALDGLLTSLLDISRLDANIIEPKLSVFNVENTIQLLVEEYLPLATDKGIELKSELEEVVVETDPVLLLRIARNLLSNAIRYTNEGSVTISCKQYKKELILSITDTGLGIPEDEKSKIFLEFYQLNNPERDRNKGLGLGLSIVHKLTELLGGEVELLSGVQKGTTATYKMPISVKGLSSETAEAKAEYADKRASILVIDDEVEILWGMKDLLEDFDHTCVTALSQNEAIEKIVELDFIPDLIIADYRLRDHKTGVEAIEAVREEVNVDIPAIIVTGDTEPKRIVEIEKNGFDVLFKPVTPSLLKTSISKVLS